MGDLALEHVETQLPRFRHVTLAGDEANNGVSIDEAADQPAARNAIDMDALTRHPGSALEIGYVLGLRSFVFRHHGGFLPGSALQFSNQSLNHDASAGTKKINRLNLAHPFAQAPKLRPRTA